MKIANPRLYLFYIIQKFYLLKNLREKRIMTDNENNLNEINEILGELSNENFSEFNNNQTSLEDNIVSSSTSELLGYLAKNEQNFQSLSSQKELSSIGSAEDSHKFFSSLLSGKNDNSTTVGKPQTSDPTIPKFSNPIDFVNYMETVYIKTKIEGNENLFQLKNYKEHSKIKYTVMNMEVKKTLTERIFNKKKNIITSLGAKRDKIIIGTNIGKISIYSCDKELEFREVTTTSEIVAVSTLDISDDSNFVLAGFYNGIIALWDISQYKCKKIISGVHTIGVIAIKFLNIENKYYEFLSTDLKGNVYKFVISEGFFTTSYDYLKIMEYRNPVFILDLIDFNYKTENEKDFNFKSKPLLVGFGCLEYVMIYQLEPSPPKELLKFEYPKYLKKRDENKTFVPDISFGTGYVPDKTVSTICNSQQKDQTQRLLCISWEKVLYLYLVPVRKDQSGKSDKVMFDKLILLGTHVNEAPIIRMNFLNSSIIYFIDSDNKLHIINTKLISTHELVIDADNLCPLERYNNKCEIQKIITLEDEPSFQAYIPSRVKGTSLATYHNLIKNQTKKLYILGKNKLLYGSLSNWEQTLKTMESNSEWLNALCLGLDIFKGENISLPDIPSGTEKRKEIIGYFLRSLILQYINIHTGSDYSHIQKYDDLLGTCMNICIEFCIEINDIDYLLNQIQPSLDLKSLGEQLFEKMEPFILSDKIKNKNFGHLTVAKIVDIYQKKKKFKLLSQILTHLDIESIDSDDIKELCNKNELITPLIMIYMNGKDINLFYPIKCLFDLFKKKKDEKCMPYDTLISNTDIYQIESTKQYFGHKLFWYINLVLDGKKFLTNEAIETEVFNLYVPQIFIWMFKEEILNLLLSFDSFSMFYLFTRIFTEKKLFAIIQGLQFNQELCSGIKLNDSEVKDFSVKTLLEILIEKSKRCNNAFVLEDLYEFLAKVSATITDINIKTIIETTSFLFEYSSREDERKEENDVFLLHDHSKNLDDHILYLSNLILNMLKKREKDINIEDIRELLTKCSKTEFVLVTVYFLNKLGNYSQSLHIFLNDNKIINRTQKTFEFIESTLTSLAQNHDDKIDYFKNEILENLTEIGKLSINKVTELASKWFENNHKLILSKLEKDKVCQLKYVEEILQTYKEEELPTEVEKMDVYLYLLTAHITLLCELGKIDEILPCLEKRQSYPVQDCLEKCLEYNAIDAAVYLYISTGDVSNALDISIKTLNKNVEEIFTSINIQNKIQYDNLIQKHKVNFRRCIKVCELSDDRENANNIWFKFVNVLYDISTKSKDGFQNKNTQDEKEEQYKNLSSIISTEIKELLETMAPHVSIKRIIDYVTDKYKQAEFKEFKDLLLAMLSSNSYTNSILNCVKKLLERSIEKYNKELEFVSLKGNFYDLEICDKCKKKFCVCEEKNKEQNFVEETINLFACGHKFHRACSFCEEIEENTCPICMQNEIENIVAKSDYIIKKKDTEDKINSYKDRRHKNIPYQKSQLKSIFNTPDNLAKLDIIDQNFLETNKILERDYSFY